MKTRYFHFTLGPVQAFVAQARRTRDFWAGSFLLSWLSAVAMKSVQELAGADAIKFPLPDQAFMAALAGAGHGPEQGNIPNRFMAEVPPAFGPQRARQVAASVQAAWLALADRVWERDLAGLPETLRGPAREVWQRQVPALWDMQWVLTPDDDDSAALDRRKNWRSHAAPAEPGVKCGMMDGWQELSGAPRPGARVLDAFWQAVMAGGATGIGSDLREGEQLCAPAFIKRRFVRHFKDFSAALLEQSPAPWRVHGWDLPSARPSAYYLAAAPWLADIIDHAGVDAINEFYQAALGVDPQRGEWNNEVQCVKVARAGRYDLSALNTKKFASLDAAVFFDAALENPRLFAKRDAIPRVRQALRALRDSAQQSAGERPAPSPFYAVLLMDGDSLGANMSQPERQPVISAALQQFTTDAGAIVRDNSGFLIYAGGDDVLALLPLEYALPCALALRDAYAAAFKEQFNAHPGVSFPATLSGAIEYAHIKAPLGRVLADAHPLLDDIAKEATGRDALACRVWKGGGCALTWSMPWACAISADGTQVITQQLATAFQTGGNDPMANRFFYRIRERFDLLNPVADGDTPVLNEQQRLRLMAMEYLQSGLLEQEPRPTMAEAERLIGPLLRQCTPTTRLTKTKATTIDYHRHPRLEVDAALLVRFLAQKGIETQ